jgi:alkyl hydroperoxide reductase subunit D
MSLQTLKDRLPEYAKDIKLNLGSLAIEPALTEKQRAGTFIASALGARNPEVAEAILAEFALKLDAKELAAAKAAAAVMAMNNVYYRFLHLVGNEEYSKMPAKLRMNAIASHGIARADFELWSLAVSAINGCGKCLESHEKAVREGGITAEQVQAAVRIAAAVNAAAAVLDVEQAGQPAVALAA